MKLKLPNYRRAAMSPLPLVTALALITQPALAIDYFWDGSTGSWFDQSRWQLAGGTPAPTLPNSGIDVYIRRDGSRAEVTTPGATSRDVVVGGIADRSAEMSVFQVGSLASSGSAYVGLLGEGTVRLTQDWSIAGDLWLGGDDSDSGGTPRIGDLELRGGTLSASNAYVGAARSGVGTLFVETVPNLSTPELTLSGALVVGSRRDGSTGIPGPIGDVSVTGGVDIASATGVLGEHSGSTGTMTLSAADTRWNVPGTLDVGKAGAGHLKILASARTFAGTTVVGAAAGGSGLVEVLGNSRLQSSQALTIGEFGDGTVVIAGGGAIGVGGALNNGLVQLATGPGGTGRLRIGTGGTPGLLDVGLLLGGVGGTVEFDHVAANYDLANSHGDPVSIGGALAIEHLGSGTTRIFADSVHGGPLLVRRGTMIIDGVDIAGPSSDLTIGSGAGNLAQLELRNGARALSANGMLEMAAGAGDAQGTLLLSGSGTRLETGQAWIGRAGQAEIQLTDAATISTQAMLLGDAVAASGSLSLGGVGTVLDNHLSMTAGVGGQGVVNLRGGATLRIATAPRALVLASQAGATGVLNIGTGGSTGVLDVASVFGGSGSAEINFNHTNSGYLLADANANPVLILGSTRINHLGTGRTRIRTQHLDNPAGGRITLRAGILQVEGLGRVMHSNADLVAGDLAGDQAELSVIESSWVRSLNGRLGRVQGSSGTARIIGTDSRWEMSGNLFVGGNGSGNLAVQAGGRVQANGVQFGRATGATGGGSIVGIDSHLESADAVVVGGEGSGTLTVGGGARLSAGGTTGGGLVTLAQHSGSTGILRVAGATTPGRINAEAVGGGSGSAELHFEHEAANHLFVRDNGLPVSILGSTRVFHNGNGTTRIAGTLGYTGATFVNAGTLIAAGTMASVEVTVATDAGFGGAVTIAGNLAVDAGGTLSPGDGVGTVQAANLAVHPEGQLVFELSAPDVVGGIANDLLVATGDLALGGELHVIGLPGFGAGRYPLATYQGTLISMDLVIASLPPGFSPFDAAIDLSVPGEVALLVVDGGGNDIIFQDGFEGPVTTVILPEANELPDSNESSESPDGE